ncbi:hypothetical protein [Porphyrobacter sp. GA68]|uniref:hypothetical protein n=1 Tax=Porphyrobacter sp. GA68 TaxID=2883480 RepID=UPI001D1948A6|nr:hypothetical protein [Porphyrobacter sp. GA68]
MSIGNWSASIIAQITDWSENTTLRIITGSAGNRIVAYIDACSDKNARSMIASKSATIVNTIARGNHSRA